MTRGGRDPLPEEQKALLEGLRSSSKLTLFTDLEGKIASASPACERLLGYRREELAGMRLSRIYPPEAQVKWQAMLEQAKTTGRAEGSLELRKRDGTKFGGQATLTMRRHAAGAGLEITITECDLPELALVREEASWQGEELTVLSDIFLILNRAADLETGLQRALERLLQFSGFPVGGIASVDRERGIIVPQAVVGMPSAILEDLEREPQRLEEGLSGLAMRLKEPLVVEDLVRDPRVQRLSLKESGLRMVVVIPLLASEEAVGFITLLSPSARELGPPKLRLLEVVANQLGLTLERVQSSLREKHRLSQLLLVEKVARKASAIIDLERLLDEVAAEIQRAFNYHDVLIFSVAEEQDELVRRAWAGSYRRQGPKEQRLPITEHGVLSWVVRQGRTALVNDVRTDPRYQAFFPQTRSELCVPLRRAGRVIGGINVESVQPYAFDQIDVALLEALADQLVISITNAELYRDLEKKVAQRTEELEKERDRLDLVTKSMGAGLALISKEYRTLWANDLLKGLFGEVEGKPCYETFNQQPAVCPWCAARRVFETGEERAEAEAVGKDKSGNLIWSKIVATPIRDSSGEISSVLEAVMPITERKRMEEAWRVSQERLYTLSRVATEIQGIFDEEKILALATAELARAGAIASFWSVEREEELLVRRHFSAPPELVGALHKALGEDPIGFVFPLAEAPEIRRIIRRGGTHVVPDVRKTFVYKALESQPEARQSLARQAQGAIYLPLFVRGKPDWLMTATLRQLGEEEVRTLETFARYLSFSLENARLFRELKEAQEELLRRERLAAIGQLAGSIAHNLRNPLGVISNAVFYLKSKLRGQKVREHLDLIEAEVERVDREISELLNFAFRGKPQLQRLALEPFIEQVLAHIDLPQGITLAKEFLPAQIWIEADPHQLGQALQNIIANAIEAMAGRGRLLIRASRRGRKIVLAFEDSGPGLSAAEAARVFEPLFTTKARGAGLGLTICKRIIEDHGGQIEFTSRRGSGSRLTIWLPQCEELADG